MQGDEAIVEMEAEPAEVAPAAAEAEFAAAPEPGYELRASVPVSTMLLLAKKYPNKADEIVARGVTTHGEPIVSRVSKTVTVLDVTQKYRLADGTVLPLTVETVE